MNVFMALEYLPKLFSKVVGLSSISVITNAKYMSLAMKEN